MDMQDFKIKFDENKIDLNDDYRINVKLIPRVAWKKNLDSQYRTRPRIPDNMRIENINWKYCRLKTDWKQNSLIENMIMEL